MAARTEFSLDHPAVMAAEEKDADEDGFKRPRGLLLLETKARASFALM
jgi:hypothetical protein